MAGIEILHVIFDASGSFCEPGKKNMLNYLGNTAMNFAYLSWAKVQFVFHTWNEELCEVDSVEKIPTQGVTDTEILQQFLADCKENEAVILVTDGNFEKFNRMKLKKISDELGERFAIVAAGFDAEIILLQSLSKNFYFAEDMYTAFKILAG